MRFCDKKTNKTNTNYLGWEMRDLAVACMSDSDSQAS